MRIENVKEGISIVIPSYNAEKYIERALGSLVAEADKYEIILIDDCSKDHTVDVAKRYALQNNLNLQIYVNEKNLGAGESRNKGIQLANRAYITFLDSDDYFTNNFFEHIEGEIKKNADCIIFDAYRVTDREKSYIKMFYSPSINGGEIEQKMAFVYLRGCTWGKIYKTSIIREYNIVFGDIPRNEDTIFTKTAIVRMNSIIYINEALYCYSDVSSSLMHNNYLLNIDNAYTMFRTVKKQTDIERLREEINALYLFEVMYSTTTTLIRQKRKRREIVSHYNKLEKIYDKSDIYKKGFDMKYRILFLAYRMHLFNTVKAIFMIRQKIKFKQQMRIL